MHKFSKQLFWDVNPENLDFEKHKAFIVQRVLEYGLMEDWKALTQELSVKDIALIATTLRSLDDISLNFISTLSGIPKENFRCYKLKQLQPKHWIS